ncbi:Uncharacterised protein [uncultured archaeon]|nr:Uncharacterised protein [uncultured archaeon]
MVMLEKEPEKKQPARRLEGVKPSREEKPLKTRPKKAASYAPKSAAGAQSENKAEGRLSEDSKKNKDRLAGGAKKKTQDRLMGGGGKKKDGLLSLDEPPQYEAVSSILQPLGPGFDNGGNGEKSVARFWPSGNGDGTAVELKTAPPAYDSNSIYRGYGMVQRPRQMAVTLQFRNETDFPLAPEISLRDLKAGRNYHAGSWIVTAVEIDEAAGLVKVKIAKEKDYRIVRQGDITQGGDGYGYALADVDPGTGAAVLDVQYLGKAIGQISVKPGQTYTYVDANSGKTLKFHVYTAGDGTSSSEKWAEVAILQEEHVLEDGHRFDNVDSNDLNWKEWYVAAGTGGMKKNTIMGYSTIDFSSNTISIYVDDVANASGGESRFVKGKSIQMPLDYVLRCDGMVNDWKTDIAIGTANYTSIRLEDGSTVQGNFIKLSAEKSGFFYDTGTQSRASEIFVDPLNGKVYGTVMGVNGRRILDGDIILGDHTYPENKLVFSKDWIGFEEAARPLGTPGFTTLTDRAIVNLVADGNGAYRFNPGYGALSGIRYQGLANSMGTTGYDAPLTTERGSEWRMLGTTDAVFRFNVGGNEPGLVNDGMARFKWTVLDLSNAPQFENPWETTPGLTKNGIDGVWRYPERYVIPSPNNGNYQDGIAEYWAVSQQGTVFNFTEQEFKNRLDYFAYKVRPKTGWVEGTSVVPIFGKEYVLEERMAGIWKVRDPVNDDYYLLGVRGDVSVSRYDKNGAWVDINSADPLYGFNAYIGDAAQVEDITNPSLRSGQDVLWLKKDLETFVANMGTQTVSPNSARMRLDQEPRTMSVGLDIVKNRDFGLLGTMDAIRIDISKFGNVGRITDNTMNVNLDAEKIDELYYVPTMNKKPEDNYAEAAIIYKDKTDGRYYLARSVSNPSIGADHGLTILDKDANVRWSLSHKQGTGVVQLVAKEYVGSDSPDSSLHAHTTMTVGAITGAGAKGDQFELSGMWSDGLYELVKYRWDSQNQKQTRTVIESRSASLPDTHYNAKGTEMETNSEATHVAFSLFDNNLYPTRYSVEEEYAPYEKFVARPITAPLEYTDGGTKTGYLNYAGMPWLTYPNYVIKPSDYAAQFQPNVLKSEFHIFSPLGTQHDPNANAVSNTVLGAAYHLGLENEPPKRSLAFLFNGVGKLLEQPPTITEFVPLPGNRMEEKERGTKIYGVLGSDAIKAEDLKNSLDAGAWDKLNRDYVIPPAIKVWAVQDDRNIYLLADGLPVLKMKDWKVVDPDEAAKDDPLCRYVAVLGEGRDLRDVTGDRLDKSKPALWMLPLDLFGTTYAPGEAMRFPGGADAALHEKTKDEMRVEIVSKQFAGMSQPADMYHFTYAPGGTAMPDEGMVVSAGVLLLKGHRDLYLQPQSLGADGMLQGTIFDASGGVLGSGAIASGGFVVSAGGLNMTVKPGASGDAVTVEMNEGFFDVGAQSIELSNRTSMKVLSNLTQNADGSYTYNGLSGIDNAAQTYGLEDLGLTTNKRASFDQQTPNLDSPFSMENGTQLFPFGLTGQRSGFEVFFHSNLKLDGTRPKEAYPYYWNMDEHRLIPYKEGDPMAGWPVVPSLASYLKVYPNPVSRRGALTIDLQNGIPGIVPGTPGIVDIGIYDLTARPVGSVRIGNLFAGTDMSVAVDLSRLNLMPGAYFLVMNAANNPMYESRLAKIIVTE